MRIRVLAVVLTGLLLSGCAEWGARLLQDAALAHQLSLAYVMENTGYRVAIRRECWASVMREADSMRRDGGDEAAFRAMLADKYPGLVTFSIAKEAREDSAGILSYPYICGKKPPVDPLPELGFIEAPTS